jgi:hypothetical protein
VQVASVAGTFARAVALHREAASHVEAARAGLAALGGGPTVSPRSTHERRRLAEVMSRAVTAVVPGWLGSPLDGAALHRHKLGVDAAPDRPLLVRIGAGCPLPDVEFPAVVPFLGAGHLSIDTDARDRRVAGWLRSVLLRVTAALPDGTVRVLPVDGGTLGSVFAPFRPLVEAGAWPRPATTLDGLRAVLGEAEEQISDVQAGVPAQPYLIVACAALPAGTGSGEWARLAAIAHAGPAARVHLLVAGYPPAVPSGLNRPPQLDYTTTLTGTNDGLFLMSEPAGRTEFSPDGTGLAAPVRLDSAPVDGLAEQVATRLAASVRRATALDFAALMPTEIWQESSTTGLQTVVGREGRSWCRLALDDTTPHWLVAGRTGAGKTVFLLDTLYGLASRYSPDELGLYLLDFKEGVSFAEFTPTGVDGSWVPHARTVGIESDREYGLAVLRALTREMARRAADLKRAGVTRIADLRTGRPDVAMPRLVVVIDEFQVLFAGNDVIAREAAAALEDLARKGRSYGIHLILASQTASGVEALFTKGESIFGQFPLRVALAGGGGILDTRNTAADNLPIGTAIINTAGGHPDANHTVRFPDATASLVTKQRHRLWNARPPGDQPPAVFAGYAEYHLDTDPTYARLSPTVRRRQALVGRAVDIGLPTVGFALDATPGRHLAILGPSAVGADILHAAALSLAQQHKPGTATFIVAGFAATADDTVDDLAATLTAAGHPCTEADAGHLRYLLTELADPDTPPATPHTYLVVFAADVVASALVGRTDNRTGLDDLRDVLRSGPAHGIHLLGWWRTTKRFADTIGGSAGREDVACLVALNVPTNELATVLGDHRMTWQPRHNRALLIDRHDQRSTLIVPYVRPGRHDHREDHAL